MCALCGVQTVCACVDCSNACLYATCLSVLSVLCAVPLCLCAALPTDVCVSAMHSAAVQRSGQGRIAEFV